MNFSSLKFLPACGFAFAVLSAAIPLNAQDEEAAPEEPPAKPPVERIDEQNFRIGDVTFDTKTREIRFPALINMREGLLEYLIVHQNGKIHESLFRTETSPTNLNLALTLLRYKPSKELYRIPKEPGVLSGDFYQEPEETRLAARVAIEVETTVDGKTKRLPVNEWIRHETTAKAMPPTHWVYGGSEIYEGKYVPESTGDFAAIFITNSSIFNYPGEDNYNDEVWTCMTDRIPELDTKVTLVIAPYKDKP